MVQDTIEPLDDYVNKYRDRFKKVAAETFESLVAEAGVDVQANRQTCTQLYGSESELEDIRSGFRLWVFFCVVLWMAFAAGIVSFFIIENITEEIILYIGAGMAVVLVLLLALVHPKIKSLKDKRKQVEEEVAKLKQQAWEQMQPLNDLYDWDILARMITKAIPEIKFDPYFNEKRLNDLKSTYGWTDYFNTHRSVLYSHSGTIKGNPFVICRTKRSEMGTKTYYGHKTIHWTTREMGSDGKYHTVTRSETLTASYTAPYPLYLEDSRLIYANMAAPDLKFHRRQSDLAGKENSLAFKWQKRRLKKKSRDLDDNDYAMLTNEVFEVAFNTSDRNNNQQFSLMFTPLAQESMLNLLRDEKIGYGDDFDFIKNGKINTILPDHLQEMDIDMNPSRYKHFDFDKASRNFADINLQYFRAIYFSFAPLLCIPMYTQMRPQHDIYGRDMMSESTFWEHEALANFWGTDKFKHPSCVTDCLLKTQCVKNGAESVITVYAHGYRKEVRLTHVGVFGGDGRVHSVPVYWDEYIPVTGTGTISMKEVHNKDDDNYTAKERLNNIADILNTSGMKVYRRHIASKV